MKTMSEDIVKKLRSLELTLMCNGADGHGFMIKAAADEIENARAERAYWKHRTEQLARYIKKHHDVPSSGCRCVACKVVRELERSS
jgi:hypothetical protein